MEEKCSIILLLLLKTPFILQCRGLLLTPKLPLDCFVEGSRWFLRSEDAPYRVWGAEATLGAMAINKLPKSKEHRGSRLKMMGRKRSEMKLSLLIGKGRGRHRPVRNPLEML